MADDRKSRNEGGARRVAEWLANHQADFEQGNVVETQLAAVGLPEKELSGAVDYLENREEVVRFPHGVLKPGRGWPELRARVTGRSAAAGTPIRPSSPEFRA